MIPQKYLDDLESSANREQSIHHLKLSLLFLVSMVALGPFLHEISHAAVLELNQCIYSFTGSFSLYGFHASIQPFCSLEKSSLILFYSSGYLSTIIAGGLMKLGALEAPTEKLSHYLAATGTGILISIILTIGAEGDIASLMEILGAPAHWESFIVLFVVLGVFLSSLKGLNIVMGLEWEEGNV